MRTPSVSRKRMDLTVPANITKLDFLKYRLHERVEWFGLFHMGKLFHQFAIDGWASVEQDRLNWTPMHYAAMNGQSGHWRKLVPMSLLGRNVRRLQCIMWQGGDMSRQSWC